MARVSFDFKKGDLVWISLIVILIGVGFVYATVYTGATPDNGHVGDSIWVKFNGTEQTLESALNDLADGVIGGGGGGSFSFGVSESKSKDSTYTATTDGIVVVGSSGESSGTNIYSGTTTSNMVVVTHANSHGAVSLTFPIKRGNSWKVTGAVGYVHWIPIISSGGGTVPNYDSGWFSVNTGQQYTLNHNLETLDFSNIMVMNRRSNGEILPNLFFYAAGRSGVDYAYGAEFIISDANTFKINPKDSDYNYIDWYEMRVKAWE